MAKSFRRAAGAPAPAPTARPSAGPDFFDLLTGTENPAQEQEAPGLLSPPIDLASAAPEAIMKATPAPGRRKPRAVGNTPLPGLPAFPKGELREAVPATAAEEEDTRQTFVVGKGSLERLRDYVHARRSAGDYRYSQKQALGEAIAEFLAARQLAPPRSAEVRAHEQQFRERIQKGREASQKGRATGQLPPAEG